jgi:hypothetical protein
LFFFSFWGTRWIQGLMLARQALYYLSHISTALYTLIIFQIGFYTFGLGPVLDHDPPVYVAGITDMSHCIWP